MKTFRDLCTDINTLGIEIKKKCGKMGYRSKYPSITDLVNGVKSIPQTIFSGTNYLIICAETANTTFTLKKDDTQIASQTNDTIVGGAVTFQVSENGEYTIIAEQNGAEKWQNTVRLVDVGQYNCKCGKLLDTYSEEEIDLACKNHYAKYMWNLGDFKIGSFMGTSNENYKKRYIIGFNDDVRSDTNDSAEITWCWLNGTPSDYKMNNTSINNTSYEGSLGRQYCLPSGTDYYVYDSSVTAETEGTYYTPDYTTGEWVEKTLPSEFTDEMDYYTKNTTTADGAIYAGLPADLVAKLVPTKQKTWVGITNGENKRYSSSTTKKDSTSLITTNDKIFLLSAHRVFGDSIFINYFSYNNNEGEQYKYFKEYKEGYVGNVFGGKYSRWYRSPAVYNSFTFCYWNYNGYVNYSIADISSRLLVCACQ